jgi:RNA polymerase sigma-70 factor (sigma-E family)
MQLVLLSIGGAPQTAALVRFFERPGRTNAAVCDRVPRIGSAGASEGRRYSVPEDFDGFVAGRGPALLRLALMLTRDRHAAEDLVQTALAKTYRHWTRVQRADSPEAYVRRIVVREHLSRRRRRSTSEIPSGYVDSGHTDVDPGAASAARDAAWRLLAELPKAQRTVLVLRYYVDLTDDAIAELLRCSASTVRSNASRGIAALREISDPPGDWRRRLRDSPAFVRQCRARRVLDPGQPDAEGVPVPGHRCPPRGLQVGEYVGA